ncbi:MAG: HD domain-containing protein [Bacteroidota bacterium]|nr:HD domain-containing protein [Bacteroidota bacterium]MDP3146501.1 HD domain-containing protein [Bacteroidota bacterium]
MYSFLNQDIFKLINECANEINVDAYAIGGYVRDIFLKRNSKDIDIVSIGKGIDLATALHKKLGEESNLSVFKNFGTAQVKYRDIEIEFVGARKESYTRGSRKPVVEDGTLEDDQNRRDFTINALAIGVSKNNYGKLLDPFNGLADLENKLLRTPLDPNITYSDDPLRMMRAIRFATQLNFTIHPDSLHAITTNKERINIVSKERISDELNKIILSPIPSVGFKLLFDTGLLHLIFPEMVKLQGVETINGLSHKDNFYHTLEVLDNTAKKSDNLWLRWAAILHDIAKPATKRFEEGHGFTFHGHEDKGARMVPKIFTNLKLPLNEKMKYVQKLVELHLRPIVLAKTEVSDSAVRRLLFEAGEEIDDLMLLCESDITTKNPNKVKRYMLNFEIVRKKLIELEEKDKIRNWQPPISGEEIMKLYNLPPSKEIGILKNSLKDAILDGEVENNYECAKKFLDKKFEEVKTN